MSQLSRVFDIRKAALAASITGVSGLVMPVAEAIRGMRTMGGAGPRWWTAPLLVGLSLLVLVPPLFYFALYRNEGELQIPKRLRLFTLAAAVLFGLVIATELPAWFEALGIMGAHSVVVSQGAGRFGATFAELANLAYLALLVAIFRNATGEPATGVPVSRLLAAATRIAAIVCGVWAAFGLLRVVAIPYTYSVMRDYAVQAGRTAPPLLAVVREPVRTFLVGFCMFAAPYIVMAAIRDQTAAAAPTEVDSSETADI